MKALVVEDDEDVAQALMEGLRQHGWAVQHLATGRDVTPGNVAADIVLLDLNLPDIDGLELCRRIRESTDVPIIAVTGRSDSLDQALGLWLGADDYIVKPYQLHVLLARMAAVLRRAAPQLSDCSPNPACPSGDTAADDPGAADNPLLRRGELTIDQRQRRVLLRDAVIPLTRKEFELLALLAAAPGRVFTREYIVETVWMHKWIGKSRTIDAHVASLRRKLGDPGWIETVRGVGLRFANRFSTT